MKTCTFDGCVKERVSQGLCSGHYQQQQRGWELRPLRVRGTHTSCGFHGCQGKPRTKGLCPAHYGQQRDGKELQPLRSHDPLRGCSFDGCDRKHQAHGLCVGHYQQQYEGKELRPLRPRSGEAEERFWMKVDKASSPDGCWLWTGGTGSRGYGSFCVSGRVFTTSHRYSYQLATGEDITGVSIHHKCANTRCVNPDHLERASRMENTLEMLARRDYEATIARLAADNQWLTMSMYGELTGDYEKQAAAFYGWNTEQELEA